MSQSRSLKILLLSPVNPRYKDSRPLPKWQAQYCWLKALQDLGHQVTLFRYTDAVLYPRTRLDRKCKNLSPEVFATNTSFNRVLNKTKPNITLVSAGCWMITAQSIKNAAQFGPVVLLSGVSPIQFNSEVERTYLPYISTVVTNDSKHTHQWKKLGAAQSQVLPISSVYPPLLKNISPNPKYSADVSIVSTLFSDRQQQLIEITSAMPSGIQFNIWGWVPPKTDLDTRLLPFYQGEAWGKQVYEIYASTKIGLNLSPDHMRYCGNIRPFEITAMGAALVSDKLHPSWFTPNKEALEFKNLASVGELLSDLLADNSQLQKLRQSGKSKTLNQHTYHQRFAQLLTQLE